MSGVSRSHRERQDETPPPPPGERHSGDTSVTFSALRGVEDPAIFARNLQEWKHAATDRNRLPRYRIIKRLGQGSQGLVFAVADRDCMREIALKTLHAGARSAEDISRFIHEAQINAQLEHPGIVPVHDLDVLPDGTLFYTMKRIEGRTLAEMLGDHSRPDRQAVDPGRSTLPPLVETLQILLKVCDTVAFAHSRGVIHRDLKPRNLMVGNFGEVLVMDWGLAKILDGPADAVGATGKEAAGPRQVLSLRSIDDDNDIHQTLKGSAVGTPAYMSPEQARGEPADVRSDIYSLGVILYLCLSGESPYERGRVRYTLEQAAQGTWTRLDHLAQGRRLPRRLVAIVHTCMAWKPEARYQSAQALAADLRAFLAGEAVAAYRETPIDRWTRIASARGRSLLAAAAVLAAVAGLGGIWSWSHDRSRAESLAVLGRSAAQHELMGELEEARRDLERIVDQRPDDHDALDGLQRLRSAWARRSDEMLAKQRRTLEEAAAMNRQAVRALLAEAAAADDDARRFAAQEAEAAPTQDAAPAAARGERLVAAQERLFRAVELLPGGREPRDALVRFCLARLAEAEELGEAGAQAFALATIRGFDDGHQAAVLGGSATIEVPAGAPPLRLLPLSGGEGREIPAGARIDVPGGRWRISGPAGMPVERLLHRGETLRIAWPTAVPAGCAFLPGGRVFVDGAVLEIGPLIAGPVLSADDELGRHLEERSAADGIAWRVPTCAERRLMAAVWSGPEVLDHAGSRWLSTDGRHRSRAPAHLPATAVVRLVAEHPPSR